MSFDIRITKQLGQCAIDCTIVTSDQLAALVGPSGTGKSSVLNCIAGLIQPDQGNITVGGRSLFDPARNINVQPNARGCGYAFQDNRLFPHLTVEQNLKYGAPRAGRAGDFSLPEIAELLDLTALLKRKPVALSGGEQRRVAIARVLLSGPEFLLLDEPLSSLDAARGEAILTIIERLRDETDIPILYVSHNLEEVARLTQTVLTLS